MTVRKPDAGLSDQAADSESRYLKLYGCYDDRDCPGVPPGGVGYVYATLNVLFQ